MITVLIEGWTELVHSYALVNLMQLVSLHQHFSHRVRLFKKEVPPYRPHWKRTPPSQILTLDEHAILSQIPDWDETTGPPIDLVYRISYPFDIRDTPRDAPLMLFYTSESQVLSDDMFVGGTVEDFIEKCKNGRIHPITPSAWSANACIRLGVHPTVVPHGVNMDIFAPTTQSRSAVRASLGIPDDAFVFMHVGAMTLNKNLHGILTGFVGIALTDPNVYMLLKGQELYNAGMAVARCIGQLVDQGVIPRNAVNYIHSRVVLVLQDVSCEQLATLYNAADCYTAIYYQEGFNLPVLEALACGLPVIIPDDGPTNDYVPPECSFLVPSIRELDPQRGYMLRMDDCDIRRAMERAMKERRRWATNDHFQAYSWKNIAKRLVTLMEHCAPPTSIPSPAAGADLPYVTGERLQDATAMTLMTEDHLPYFRASRLSAPYTLLPGNRTTFDEMPKDALLRTVGKHPSYFVYGDQVRSFLERIAPRLEHPFTLVSHNSDENIDGSYASLIHGAPYIDAWYAVNTCFEHPKLHPLPIGIANSMWPHGDLATLDRVRQENPPKTELCYFGFRAETNPKARGRAMELAPYYPWIEPNLPYKEYLRTLAKHRFCICPEGNGADTHRFWECVYLGVIPIVLRSRWAEIWRTRVPMLMVHSWLDARPELLTAPHDIGSYTSLIRAPKSLPHTSAVVLVHLGRLSDVPYLRDCILQLRLFYTGDVFLYTDDDEESIEAWKKQTPGDVMIVTPQKVPMSEAHRRYIEHNPLSHNEYRSHFWYHCSRRFLAIHDVVSHFRLRHVIHIENDVLVYQDLQKVTGKLARAGYKIGGTFANPSWIIPGLVYFANDSCTGALASFFEENKLSGRNDMEMLAAFASQVSGWVRPLPVVPPDYPLPVERKRLYRPNIPSLNVLFDAAAIGQYIGGVDPRNIPGDTVGYINPDSEYQVNKQKIEWRTEDGLRVPYMNNIPICNLHIHSKDLRRWSSIPDSSKMGRK